MLAMMPVGAYLALQMPSLQTWAAKKAASRISEELGTEVSIGKVYYIFFNRLIAKDLYILYSEKDTLISCDKLSVKFSASDALKGRLRLSHLHLRGGSFNIVKESDSTTNLSRIFAGRDSSIKSGELRLPDLILRELIIDNFGFTVKNPYSQKFGIDNNSINFSNLSIRGLSLRIDNIKSNSGAITGSINKLSFIEDSGFRINQMKTAFTFSESSIELRDFILKDESSHIYAEEFKLTYNNLNSFSTFTDSVSFDVNFKDSRINFGTISKFAPTLQKNRLELGVTGRVKGPISALKTENLRLTSESGLTFINLNANITGLPNTNITTAYVEVISSTTTTLDLAYIISSLNNSKPIGALTSLSPFVKYSFTGKLTGLLDDFVAKGKITSNIGELRTDVLLRQNSQKRGFEIKGDIKAIDFNVGQLLKNKTLGSMTLETRLNALLRDKKAGGNDIDIESLFIEKIDLNNYSYRNITAAGSYRKNTFDGKVICRDPNLDLLFQGIIGISDNISYYDFYSDVIYADLAALNFDKRDSLSAVSFRTLANFTQDSKGDIDGTINIRGLNFSNSKGNFPIGDISVQSSSERDNFSIYLRSAFAEATYKGSDFFTNFIDKIVNISLNSNLPAYFPVPRGEAKTGERNTYDFNVRFNDTRAITEMLLPGLQISSGTLLKAAIDRDNRLTLSLNSNNIGYKNNYSNNLSVNLYSDTSQLKSVVISDRMHILGLNLDSNKVELNLKNNLLKIRSEYTNSGDLENSLDFNSEILFTPQWGDSKPIVDISISPSELFLNGERWKFAGSKIVKQDSTYVFHDFNLFREEQYLNIDGIISLNNQDTLSVVLRDIDISAVNSFIKKQLDIKGRFTGSSYAINLYKEPQVLVNLKGTDVSVYGHNAGDVELKSEWDNSDKSFKISLLNTLNNRTPLNISGRFIPQGALLELSATLDNMSLSYFEPFLEGIVSRTSGGVSGILKLDGPLDKLKLTGENTVLNNLGFLVDFTKVNYTLNGQVIVNEKGVNLNNVAIKDRLGNTGRIAGGLNWNYFKELYLNTAVTFNNIEALSTGESDNSAFYGTAFGTGRVSISGPLNRIFMDISVTTNRNTSIHIPLASSTEVSAGTLLTFKEPQSKLNLERSDLIESRRKEGSELQVKLRANMTPEAAMLIEIDKSVGDIITGFGSGLITLDINPSKDLFSIQGDYIIHSGSYKFVLQGFIEKDFTIQEGGNIGFNGDILKTNLNLTANYRTKAAINTLISDTSSVSSRRNVDCQINMSGPLMNPRLSFAIDIPDIDPLTKARVNAALNTEDKVVKQVMSLLVSGSFIPDVQSSIVNNSTILYSNATEVLSNQINKIFNQLDIPLDLSFNYQPGQNGRDIFDAAVSAQLFNNRVIVNGNIGNSRYSGRTGDVAGDIDAEIKLDERGRFRARIFSHSADQYSNYLDNSQRNGIGIAYQEEFSSFKELLSSMFKSRRKRERLIKRDMPAIKPQEEPLLPPPSIISF